MSAMNKIKEFLRRSVEVQLNLVTLLGNNRIIYSRKPNIVVGL